MHPHIIPSINKRITAELLAYAVFQLFPNVTLVGGGVNKLGFFYDFIFAQQLPTDSLSLIEVELRKILKENHPLRFANMMRENAQTFFRHRKQFLLAEKAGEEESNIVELLQIDSFSGLCPSSEVQFTDELTSSVKILDSQIYEIEFEGNVYQAVRFVGNCFANPQELKSFSKQYERHRKKANHLDLGKQLDLFFQSQQLSAIDLIWLPKGEQLRENLQNWVKPYFALQKVQFVTSVDWIKQKSRIDKNLFHLGFQKDKYHLVSSRLLAHSQIIAKQCEKKQQLPIKIGEYGISYKSQPTSELNGLLCSHSFFADQTTIYCKKEEALKEIISFLLFIEQIIKILSFEACWYLVTSVAKSSKAQAEKEAVEKLIEAVQSCEYPFQYGEKENEKLEGPRLELRIRDKLQREWSCSALTIVVHELKILDFLKNQVENKEDLSKTSLLIKQTIWGSLDRFIALLLEHYEGDLPIWLAPEQFRILVISKSAQGFAESVLRVCQERGMRVTVDLREIKLSEKVRDAGMEKISTTVIIGENEAKKECLTVQYLNQSGKSQVLTLDQFLDKELLKIKCPILK